MKTALVIAHEPDGLAGMVGDRLEQRGFELTTHIVCQSYDHPDQFEPFPDFSRFDIIVPMGSVHSVYDTDTIGAWIGEEIELLREAFERDQPILGVCFGGQALATALGGTVEKADGFEVGWSDIEMTGDTPDFPAGPWFEWHYDKFTVPPEATELARNDFSPQVFRQGRALGTQFHPEVSRDHLAGFLEGGGDAELVSKGLDPAELLAETASREAQARERCNQLVDWFLANIADISDTELEPANK